MAIWRFRGAGFRGADSRGHVGASLDRVPSDAGNLRSRAQITISCQGPSCVGGRCRRSEFRPNFRCVSFPSAAHRDISDNAARRSAYSARLRDRPRRLEAQSVFLSNIIALQIISFKYMAGRSFKSHHLRGESLSAAIFKLSLRKTASRLANRTKSVTTPAPRPPRERAGGRQGQDCARQSRNREQHHYCVSGSFKPLIYLRVSH